MILVIFSVRFQIQTSAALLNVKHYNNFKLSFTYTFNNPHECHCLSYLHFPDILSVGRSIIHSNWVFCFYSAFNTENTVMKHENNPIICVKYKSIQHY